MITMINPYISLILFSILQYTNTQYLSLHNKATSPSCNSSGPTSVEHFFNLIFAEFHDHPPICVCVQMCEDSPTYCYPNGCLKRAGRKKETVPVPIRNQDITKPVTFLVTDGKDYLERFLDNHYGADKVQTTAKPEELPLRNEIRLDPFKNRYKSFFKSYKKLPKVHLRYNLRDQVKNIRAEQIKEKSDVSNTRWPARVNERKQFFIDASENQENIGETGKFKMMPSEAISPSRFFKRDLSKSHITPPTEETKNETGSPLVLQNLIEYLIEGSFKPLGNDTEFDLKMSLDYSMNNTTTKEAIELPVMVVPKKRFTDLLDENLVILNETTNVISINFTNENTDQNKYIDDSKEMYKNVFNEMIETLSNSIDRENNSSIEFINKIVGTNDFTIDIITTPETATVAIITPETVTAYDETTTTGDVLQNAEILKSHINEVEILSETTKTMTSDITEVPNKAKSRQKITRKLQNSKVN